MAKGTNIGFLNFGIGGDNKELIAKLEEGEKKALRIQSIMQSIGKSNSSVQGSTLLQQTRSQNVINESLERQRALQERTAREVMRTEQLRQRMLSLSSSSQGGLNRQVQNMNNLLNSQNGILGSLTKKAAGLFSVYQAGALVKEIVSVRGEIQQLEFAFETMLGSKAASENMMKDIVNLSLETPYTLTEMAGNVKQLIAMGIEADKVVQTMKNLGDVAAGVSVPIWRIAINYGQVAALGKLQGREVRDFAMAGVPIVQQLADQMGKTTAEIQNMVSAGKIGFPDVEEAFRRMSSEGGKFNNMMQKQNSSVLGQIGKLKEQVQLMLNSIGESSEGVIYGVLETGSTLVHNYEKIGKALVGLIGVYGVYKTASLINTIATSGYSAALGTMPSIISKVSNSFKALTATMRANPYVAMATLIAGLVATMWALKDSTDASKEAQEKYNKIKDETIRKEEKHRNEIDQLISAATNQALADLTRVDALEKLKQKYPEIFEQYNIEKLDLADILSLKRQIAEMDAETSVKTRKNLYEEALEKVKKAEEKLAKATNSPVMRFERTKEAQRELNQAIKDLEPFEKDYKEDRINSFLSNISKMTDEQIQSELAARKRLIARMDYNGFKNGQTKGGLLDDKFDKDQLKRQTDALTVELEKRKLPEKNYIEWKTQYNTELADLIKKRKEIESNPQKLKEDVLSNQLSEIDEQIKTKREQIKNLGGETKEKKETSKKDPLVDQLKNQIELIKSAQTEYGKLKQIMSEEDAFAKIKEQIPFKNFTKEMLTEEGLLDIITSQIATLSDKKQSEAVQNWLSSLFSLSIDTAAKINKRNTDNIEAELKKYKAEKSLFDSLYAITGDKGQSAFLAFGDVIGKAKKEMESFKGNVDLFARPIIDSSKLVEKGWADAGEGIATVFSSQYGVLDEKGKEVEILVTPILPDGTVLSQDELEDYIGETLSGTNILNADTKGIVIAVDVDKDGSAGERLHELQEIYYKLSDGIITYREKLKEAIASTNDPELKKKLSEELTDLEFSDKADFSKQMAELVAEFQSITDKINLIRQKGEDKAKKIRENADNVSQDEMNKRLRANEEFVNKQISELTNGAMQASEVYQKLFSNMSDISNRELQSLINQWKTAIDQAKKGNDGRFTISIQGENFSVTEKELSSLTKRILKSEKELRNRNPFTALKDSLSELAENRSQVNAIKKSLDDLRKEKEDALKAKESGNNSAALDIQIDNTSVKIGELESDLETLGVEGATSMMKLGNSMADVGQKVAAIASSLSDMFDALGNEGAADTLGFVGEMTSSISNIGKSIMSGDPVGAVTGVINGITSVFRQHDKKLEKRIKKSQLEVKKLQNSYSDLSRFIERQLGAVTEKQAQEQIDNLKSQQAELEKQMALENRKKKTDKSTIEDYKNSISELQDQIKYFYEELLDEEYGINLKDIASQLSDSLVDAFKSGEDAAKAFDNTVSDIINQLASKMITMQVLEPAMNQIRDYLFGDNGVFNDGELSVSDAQGLVGQMSNLKESIGKSKDIWDALNEAAKQAGIDLGESSTKDTLSKGIESITEDTANLLASYLNAIRLDVSVNRQFLNQLVQLSQLNSNTFAAQLAELVKIQANTLATANNTSRLVLLTESTNNILQKATVSGSGTRFNI